MKLKLSPAAVVFAGMVAAMVIGLAGTNAYLPGGGDNAGYIAEAESWLKFGKRTYLYQDGMPPAALKPPLFPLMLSGIEHLFGRNIFAMKAMLVCFAALSVCVSFLTLRVALSEPSTAQSTEDEGRSRIAAGLAFWFALCPLLIRCSHDVLSDVPFTVFSLAAIGLAGRVAKPKSSALEVGLLLLVLLLATLLRAAGIIIAGSCIIYFVLESLLRWRDSHRRRLLTVAGLLAFFCFLYVLNNLDEGKYVGFVKAGLGNSAPSRGELSTDRGVAKLIRVASFYFVFQPAEIAAYEGLAPPMAIYALGALAFAIVLTGTIVLFRTGRRLAPVCCLSYQCVLLLWPAVDTRFFLPTLPLYLCLFWTGAAFIFGRLPGAELKAAFVALVALIPAVSIWGTLFFAGQDEIGAATEIEWIAGAVLLGIVLIAVWRTNATEDVAANGEPAHWRLLAAGVALFLMLAATRSVSENVIHERRWGPAPVARGWPELYAAAEWLKNNAKSDEPVVSSEMSLVWLWSGVQGVPVPRTSDVTEAAREIGRAKYAILDDLAEDRLAHRFLRPVIEQGGWEPCFRVKGKGENQGETVVFRRISPSKTHP